MNNYVCTPVDKAANNIAFICPKFYLENICREIGFEKKQFNNQSGFYVPCTTSIDDLVKQHIQMSKVYKLDVEQTDCNVPQLYGIPKFHKTPLKFRFIAGAANSSTKPISVLLLNVLTLFKTHFTGYCGKIERVTGHKRYISVDSSWNVIQKLNKNESNFDTAHTYDFSTLYTRLSHDSVIHELHWLTDLLFDNVSKKGCKYVNCLKNKSKYATVAFYDKEDTTDARRVCLDRFMVKNLILDVITNSYITFSGQLMRQRSGIPMGGNASPLVADLVLSAYEYKYLCQKSVKWSSSTSIFRYIDDILAVNKNITTMIDNAYPNELGITSASGNNGKLDYLDFTIQIGSKNLNLYNKTDVFNFDVIRSYHASSCVRKSMITGVIIGNLVRYVRIITQLPELIKNVIQYFTTLIKSGHDDDRIAHALAKFCASYDIYLWKYGIFTRKECLKKLIHPILKFHTIH